MKTFITFLLAISVMGAYAAQPVLPGKKISGYPNVSTPGDGDFYILERADGSTNVNNAVGQMKVWMKRSITNDLVNTNQLNAALSNLLLTDFVWTNDGQFIYASDTLPSNSSPVTIRNADGSLFLGVNAYQDVDISSTSTRYAPYTVSMLDSNEPNTIVRGITLVDSENYGYYNYIEEKSFLDTNGGYITYTLSAVGIDEIDEYWQLKMEPILGGSKLIFARDNVIRFQIQPGIGVTETPHIFGSSLLHTSGNLFEWWNSNQFSASITYDGRLTITNVPGSGDIGAWDANGRPYRTNLTGSGEANTASNLGASNVNTQPIFYDKSSVDLRFRQVTGGSNVTVTGNATSVVFNVIRPVGNVVYVDKVYGNDTNGLRNELTRPFSTLRSANTNALAGDTIVVRPGVYAFNGAGLVLKQAVNWYFEEGAAVSFGGTGGVISDADGPVTSSISGHGCFTNTSGNGPVLYVAAGSKITMECKNMVGNGASFGSTIYLGDADDTSNAVVSVTADLIRNTAGWAMYLIGTFPTTNFTGKITVKRAHIDNVGAGVAGIFFSAWMSGLTLRDCVITTDSTAMESNNNLPINARIYGRVMSNMAKTSDITFITGASHFEVDTDVRLDQ